MSTRTDMSATEVKVWDPLVRIFHWSLVVTFALAYVTGEEETPVHEWAGYLALALIAVRVVWGFVGTRHARFADFVFGPSTVLGYARDMLAGRARRHLGHNPLGGAMIIALLTATTATGISGWLLERTEPANRTERPVPTMTALLPIALTYADRDEYRNRKEREHDDGVLEELHELLANLTLLLVFLHIGGVIAGSIMHRENLVRAMFTGRKRD